MTSKEVLNKIITGKIYFEEELDIIEKDLENLEKYERALEIIAQKINPSVIIVQNDHYCLCVPHPSPYHNSYYRYLSEEEGKILFELFGGEVYKELEDEEQ